MLNVKSENGSLHIKGSKFMYVWMALATVGFLIGCIILIINGLKFESSYSLLYLGGGLIFTPFYIYITLWSLPGFLTGRILLTIIPGERGSIASKKGKLFFDHIQNIQLI